MKKSKLNQFRAVLEEKRDAVIRRARETMDQDMTLDASELPDEMDLASSEYMQSFKAVTCRNARGAGVCDDCEEPISLKRLEARPETELCIRCKEDQERNERDFA